MVVMCCSNHEDDIWRKNRYARPKTPRKPWRPNKPPLRDTIICPNCGKDTNIPRVLWMVIPPEGLACPHCGDTVVNGPTEHWL